MAESNTPGAATPRGPYQNGIRRRREIVESATRVFASYGFTSGSLRRIADEVGVTPAALTRHFGNKEGLLSAVLAKWDRDAKIRNSPDIRGQLQWLLNPGIDLIGSFSHALSGYLERWTGHPDVRPALEGRN